MSSAHVVAAMCGCWKRESGVNPGIWESLIPCAWDFQYDYTGKGGYGLGQWTNIGTPYGRCYNLHQYCVNNGYADGSGAGQCAFVVYENYWSGTGPRLGYTTLSQFLNSTSTDIEALVYDFLACWEGVPGNAYDERLEAARVFLSYIQRHASDDPSLYSWTSNNNYMGFQSAAQLANVMCIFHAFNGEAPPDPPGPPDPPEPPAGEGRLPVWLLYKFRRWYI